MVNLFFGGGAYGGVLSRRKKLGLINESFAWIDLYLHVGDISDPFNVGSRRDIYNVYIELDNYISEQIVKLNKLLETDRSLCIWFSAKDTDEYLGMLAVISCFGSEDIDLYLCDCTERCNAVVYIQDMKEITPFERHALTMDEKEAYLSEWANIQSENSALRIIRDGKVISLPADYFDDRIISIIGRSEVKVAEICQPLLCNELPRMLYFIFVRLRQLIAEQRIIVVKEVFESGNPNEKPTEKFMQFIVRNSDEYLSQNK